MRRDLFQGYFRKQRCDQVICHTIGDGLMRQQFASTRYDLMTTVENTDLHGLIGMDLIRKNRSDTVPIRATCAEIVFDNPLAEFFVGNWDRVVNPKGLHQLNLARTSRRDNAIDHRDRKAAMHVNPVGEVRVGKTRKPRHCLMQNSAVALDIVTAKTCKRSSPRIPSYF